MNDRRLGKFFCAPQFLTLDSDGARMLMSQCIILEARYDVTTDRFEYTALSKLFAAVPQGNVVPVYELIFSGNPPKISVIEIEHWE